MGAALSLELQYSKETLAKIAGTVPIDSQDIFWKRIFQINPPLASINPAELQEVVNAYSNKILLNNPTTQNFSVLLSSTLTLLHDAQHGKNYQSAANAMCFLSLMFKHVADSGQFQSFYSLFDLPPATAIQLELLAEGHHTLIRSFVHRLFVLLAEVQASELSYVLLHEAIQLLLVCASTQLYTAKARPGLPAHPFLELFHQQQQQLSCKVVQRLLHLFIIQPVPSSAANVWTPGQSSDSSFTKAVTSAAASFLWLPLRTFNLVSRSPTAPTVVSPLAEHALLLLLVLVYNPDEPPTTINPFKHALCSLQDSAFGGSSAGWQAHATAPFSQLFDRLSEMLVDEQTTLLAYSLLHNCQQFQDYVLSRTDVENFVVPVLKMLYSCPGTETNQLYMLQILILILSQDHVFCKNVHHVVLPSVPWYKEHNLGSTSLGSLIIIVLLRTIASNLASASSDLYLPSNALAALANMAPHMFHMSPHAAQKLGVLFQALAKRYMRLQQAHSSQLAGAMAIMVDAPELSVVEEFLRIVLEIVNAVVAAGPSRNLELVYALLHRQELLPALRPNPRLAELVNNLEVLVDFFNRRLDDAKSHTPGAHWTADRVLKLLASAADYWRRDKLRQLPELRFVYEQEDHSEDFFLPMVWSLVVSHTNLPWNLSAIRLFVPKNIPPESSSNSAAALPAAMAQDVGGIGAGRSQDGTADGVVIARDNVEEVRVSLGTYLHV